MTEMDELQRQAAEVRALGDLPPTAERRAAALAALESKFEGTRSIALRVLGRWGGRESVEAIRAFLVEVLPRQEATTLRGVAIEELARTAGAEDAGWVLDLYFAERDAFTQHTLSRLVAALPPDASRKRLVAELRSPDPMRRHAAVKAVGHLPYADRSALLAPLRDARVSRTARLLSER